VAHGARPPPFDFSATPFHVWLPDCCIHPILYFKNVAPPCGFWSPPTAKSWRRAWVQGVQARPQKFWFGENPGKIPEHVINIRENLWKPSQNLWICANSLKMQANGVQRVLTWKKWVPKSHDLFLEVIPNTVVMRKYSHKSGPKIVLAGLRKFGKNLLKPPKNLPASTPTVWFNRITQKLFDLSLCFVSSPSNFIAVRFVWLNAQVCCLFSFLLNCRFVKGNCPTDPLISVRTFFPYTLWISSIQVLFLLLPPFHTLH